LKCFEIIIIIFVKKIFLNNIISKQLKIIKKIIQNKKKSKFYETLVAPLPKTFTWNLQGEKRFPRVKMEH
jgi:hypothetical protein